MAFRFHPVTGPKWPRRRRNLAVFLSLACLALSIGVLKLADVWTASTRAQLAQSRARLVEAEALHKAATAKAELAVQAATLLRNAAAQGLSHRNWDERRFNLKQASLGRDTANALLGEIARAPDRYFSADQFEISVKKPEESLFATPDDPGSELMLTLRGRLLFRAREVTP